MRQQDWASCLAILANADLRDMAQRLDVPTLVVAGDLDPIFSKDHRDILRQNLRPCAELVLQNVGHNPHWEAPKEVAKAINAFLDRCLKVS
jgi:pimeloyl-ACP methyl ester carboxylesterase